MLGDIRTSNHSLTTMAKIDHGEALAVERADFDCNLFGKKVGRLELSDGVVQKVMSGSEMLLDAMKAARAEDYELIYLTTPNYSPRVQALMLDVQSFLLGVHVDHKVTYSAPLEFFSLNHLQNQLLDNGESTDISIVPYPFDASLQVQPVSPALRDLALASGEHSRFKVDPRIPKEVFEQLFTAWVQNSINRTLAHETFIAVDSSTGAEVGLITVKQKGPALVDIGLLSVAATHRRKGIASMLLNKAASWAMDRIGHLKDYNPTLQVVTQGANVGACKTYEKYGFTLKSVQIVNHVWLPEHLHKLPLQPVKDKANIPYCKQFLTGAEKGYINELLDSRLLDSSSKYTNLCSNKLRQIFRGTYGPNIIHDADSGSAHDSGHYCKHVVVTNSGTAALEMAAILCNVGAGDEVIMPSYTFSSTANAFVLRGGVPVFVDIRPDTLNIDEKLIEQAITSKTKVICCVHYAGIPCEMDTIMSIAKKHNLFVVEDAAQGFLSTYKGRQIGTIGHFGCFSFHYTKNIICGEGGALSVNCEEEMARRAYILWEKGTNRCEFMSGKIDKYEWIDVGSSHVPSEVSSAILYSQLEQCVEITNRRLANFAFYSKGLASLAARSCFRIPAVSADTTNNAHIFFLVLPSEEKRKLFQTKLKERGIASISHYVPLHAAPAGVKFGRVGKGSEGMSVTFEVLQGLTRLPVWVGLEEEELQKVVNTIEEVCAIIFSKEA